MAFDLSIDDFNTLAFSAFQAPNGCSFEKSEVAARLRTVLQNRDLAPASKNDSLELRRNLAAIINEHYRGRGTIPEVVAQALKVDKFASGFKLDGNGMLVATDHPLTDRRLVAIMTALKLDFGLTGASATLLGDVQKLCDVQRQGVYVGTFADFAKRTIAKLNEVIAAAARQQVKPVTLKYFMRTLTSKLDELKVQFDIVSPRLTEERRAVIREIVNRAVDLGLTFGAQVDKLPQPIPKAIDQAVQNMDDIGVLDQILQDGAANPEPADDVNEVVVEEVVEPPPSPEAILAGNKMRVFDRLAELGVADLLGTLNVNLEELVAFSEGDEETLKQTGDAAAVHVGEKAQAIMAGILKIVTADLDDAQKLAFLRTAIPQDGAVDEKTLVAAVKDHRRVVYKGMVEAKTEKADFNADFENKVAAKLLEAIKNDPSCKAGLLNLTKDFPQMRNFTLRMKLNHKGGELPIFDLTEIETLKAKIAGKLKDTKQGLMNLVDTSLDMDATQFGAALEDAFREAVEQAADSMAERLKAVLSENIFEDDRTILAELAFDPAKVEEFKAKLAAAKHRWDGNLVARLDRAMMEGKVAVAQLKPTSKEAPSITVSAAFRELFGPESGVESSSVRSKSKDDNEIVQDHKLFGAQLKTSIRNFFADLFTEKAQGGEALKRLVLDNATVIQALLLDPALIDSTAVPRDAKGGGDAVRTLLRQLLAEIGPDVNNGQLTAADFRTSLEAVLKSSTALETFSSGLEAAGRSVLAHMQGLLTEKLTNVLKKLTGSGKQLDIADQTLAELGASGLGSFDEGYGKFLANVLDNYFTDNSLKDDHRRMLESFFRNGKDGGTAGDALSALIKGAGPIFQKVLQSIPVEGLPSDVVKALMDVKSGLAPISDAVLKERLDGAVDKYNKRNPNKPIKSYKIDRSLGAASVGQAVHCTFFFENPEDTKSCVAKLLRPGVEEVAKRERVFFNAMAEQVSEAMKKSFGARMDSIMDELDFTKEANWVKKGQCYGKADNYGEAAQLHPGKKDSLVFESMGISQMFAPEKDILFLEVAKGKPLDRSNQEMRTRLDAMLRRHSKPDGNGGVSFEASSGFDLVVTRANLTEMYKTMSRRRTMLSELLRRFSSELFWRNLDGKDTGGGFMHGDLHGGNLLVDETTMTVIDFGNSFAFDKIDRKGLIGFIAACGFTKGELVLSTIDTMNAEHHQKLLKENLIDKNTPAPAKIMNRQDAKQLIEDITAITSKGDINDSVARGMAVVQYLQKMKVEVPGSIANFTETVMRLSTAHAETSAILEEIGNVIGELKLDPNADKEYDGFAAHYKGLFAKANKDFDWRSTPEGVKLNKAVGVLNDRLGRPSPSTDETYGKYAKPLIRLLRNVDLVDPYEGNVQKRTVGEIVRDIEKKLILLGGGKFRFMEVDGEMVQDPKPRELMRELCNLYARLLRKFADCFGVACSWEPKPGDNFNECLSSGLNQVGRGNLLRILGFSSAVSIAANGDATLANAARVAELRETANFARSLLMQAKGSIPLATRRFVDTLATNHFIWTEGDPAKFFSAKKWVGKDGAAALKNVLALNLGKLRNRLKAAGIPAADEKVENFAILPFAFRHGLVQALHALSPADFDTLCTGVADPDLVAKLKFLRNDPAVVTTLRIYACAEVARKADATKDLLAQGYSYAQRNFKSYPTPLPLNAEAIKNRKFRQLAVMMAIQYEALLAFAKDLKPKARKQAWADYSMMRFLMDEGLLQALDNLSPNDRTTVLAAFDAKENLIDDDNGKHFNLNLGAMLSRLLGYMK